MSVTFKKQIHKRDNYTCYICGLKMRSASPLLTVDHVLSKQHGGKNIHENVKTCCLECNQRKGRKEQFVVYKK